MQKLWENRRDKAQRRRLGWGGLTCSWAALGAQGTRLEGLPRLSLLPCVLYSTVGPRTQAWDHSDPAELSAGFSPSLPFCVHVQGWGAGWASKQSQNGSLSGVQVVPDLDPTSVY